MSQMIMRPLHTVFGYEEWLFQGLYYLRLR